MATDTLELDGDITAVWTPTGAGTGNWDRLDEGTTTPDDTNYLETTTNLQEDEYTINATAANHNLTSQISVVIRVGITDASNVAVIRLGLFHTSGTAVTGNPKDIACVTTAPAADEVLNDGTLKTITKTWTGLALNKTQMDSLQLKSQFRT